MQLLPIYINMNMLTPQNNPILSSAIISEQIHLTAVSSRIHRIEIKIINLHQNCNCVLLSEFKIGEFVYHGWVFVTIETHLNNTTKLMENQIYSSDIFSFETSCFSIEVKTRFRNNSRGLYTAFVKSFFSHKSTVKMASDRKHFWVLILRLNFILICLITLCNPEEDTTKGPLRVSVTNVSIWFKHFFKTSKALLWKIILYCGLFL